MLVDDIISIFSSMTCIQRKRAIYIVPGTFALEQEKEKIVSNYDDLKDDGRWPHMFNLLMTTIVLFR